MARSPRKRRPAARRRRLLVPAALLSCAALALFALYMVYLDVQVRARFEGTRWTLPAKVYASPLELYVGQELGADGLVNALRRQGYRRAANLSRAGTFRAVGDAVELHSRSFTFWDGPQAPRTVRVGFSDGQVTGFGALDDRDAPTLLRLDPLLIGSIYPAKQGEDRILVKLGEVPPMLPAGMIVVEDRGFLEHHGISPKGIARAALANLRAGGVVQGGSTISQQLVKNFYLSNEKTLARKAKEALMAVLLDAHYGKEAILEAYLNEVYLGQDGGRAIHGFGLASYFYFDRPLAELQPRHIALLVGLVKGPSYYHPRRHPERARARRDLVLGMFADAGFLSREEAAAARGKGLGVTAGGNRDTTQYPAFVDLVRRQLQGQYRDEDLTTEGLRIFTTLDPAVQTTTEARVAQGITALERGGDSSASELETAAVVTSVEGGRILALVGGRNPEYAGFNRAINAHRPVGSLLKPIVYLTALAQPSRYNVLTPLDDGALAVDLPNGDVWRPENYDQESHGANVPLHQALTRSYNLATARLALEVGLDNVVATLNSLGYPGEPQPLPSLALGAVDMSPLEVAQIYNTLASGGYYTPLLAIRAVTTRNGEPLNRYPLEIRRAYDEQSIYLLNWILQRVTRYGTARSVYHTLPASLQVAGKTGTTNDLRDSWFAGYGSNRVGVVWLGHDDNTPGRFTGAAGALQIWASVMQDIGARSFNAPLPPAVETVPLFLERRAARQERLPGLRSVGRRDCDGATAVPFVAERVPATLQPCSDATGGAGRPGGGQAESGEESNWFLDLFR